MFIKILPHILKKLPALNTQQLLCHLCEEIKQKTYLLHQNEQDLSQAVTLFGISRKIHMRGQL